MSAIGKVEGIILDATGVLYDSVANSDGRPIDGSVEAVQSLLNMKRRFVVLSNASTKTLPHFVAKLGRLGFQLPADNVIGPLESAMDYVVENRLRPFVVCHPGEVTQFFSSVHTEKNPSAVLLGFAGENFSHENIMKAFNFLEKMEDPLLITIGASINFRRNKELFLDVGFYANILRSAVPNCRQVVIGKPTPQYFALALKKLGLHAEKVVMIGDDPKGDIEGASKAGIRAIQVKTGKYRPEVEVTVQPLFLAENLLDALHRLEFI